MATPKCRDLYTAVEGDYLGGHKNNVATEFSRPLTQEKQISLAPQLLRVYLGLSRLFPFKAMVTIFI